MRIGIVGGTGREGGGLARRWAAAGHEVAIGSRNAATAQIAAAKLNALGGKEVLSSENAAMVAGSEIVVLCVPYAAHAATVTSLKSHLEQTIVIDLVVPLDPPNVTRVSLPPGGAAAIEAQSILGPSSRVVGALHHVSAAELSDPARRIDCDVLVCGDDPTARQTVMALIHDLGDGVRGLDAGPLCNAIALESLTSVILHLNRVYKRTGIGVRFTGIA